LVAAGERQAGARHQWQQRALWPDPESGELLWTVEGGSQSTPVASGDWLVLYSGTEGVGLRAYQMQADGKPKAAWSHFWVTRRYTGSPIIHEGNVYLCCGEKHQCVDLVTGKEKWVVNEINSTITSPLLVDGKLLVYENNGTHVRMVKATNAAYEQLAAPKRRRNGLLLSRHRQRPAHRAAERQARVLRPAAVHFSVSESQLFSFLGCENGRSCARQSVGAHEKRESKQES
jgi:hypothetical protein